jgi:adenylate cyclase class 2
MAVNNTEIEIRFQLDERTFAAVKDRLKKNAKFVKSSQQKDDYFNPPHKNFLEPRFPFEWLSLRQRGGRTILNYKHWYPENVETTTHCDEFETEIKDSEKLLKLLVSLGFRKLITVDKEREVYNYGDEFEIALDTVKELGHFIEIESIKDFGSVEAARKRLFEFAKTLNLDSSQENKRGYSFALLEKKGLLRPIM